MEERPLMPFGSEKWPWRQPQAEAKYWAQRSKFLPLEKSYWSPLINEDPEELSEPEKMQPPPRVHHSWDRNRSSWPMDNSLKVYAPWDQSERSMKHYDHNEPNLGSWEKSNNHTDPNRSSKHEAKQKIVLPQITMKTWNSLTSDPATWPHKLPGAKPWPKDENGKSYNPNADLVKKLGLDKQDNGSWSKEESEKSNSDKKSNDDKSRLFGSKEASKEEELSRPESFDHKKPGSERSNFSDYKTKPNDSSKSWTILEEGKSRKDWAKSETLQNDDAGAWRRKHEEKATWSNEPPASLPKIQSVGAWVMSADQSTWKPYQMKPVESTSGNSARRWSKTKDKWPGKGSWADKVNDSWMDRDEQSLWPEKNVAEIWKSSKSGSWFSKTSKNKEGEWLSKPESSWNAKLAENESWPAKANPGSWSNRNTKAWGSKTTNDDVAKFNGDSWPVKLKEESWKNGDTWPRKSTERNGWSSKNNELTPWQQKINDEWSYGKSSTGTWPAKWKQFAYHRVTAMPISKPGTTADASSAKSKNAFVAVSAVSSQKSPGNEWRKTEDDNRSENSRSEDQDRNQLQVGLERPIYAWKKDAETRTGSTKGNSTDPLENELEALRQIDFWSSYKENDAEKRSTTTATGTEKTTTVPTNTTSTSSQRRGSSGVATPNGEPLDTNRRTIPMK
ncbi:uncharacterized protein LOC117219259 [Megalopta genalis]|uniref:uncharacterized protein LOC117219259 n=1 Tax=Megalopta genalis TaxID=115081 RepID=UPI003FD195AE